MNKKFISSVIAVVILLSNATVFAADVATSTMNVAQGSGSIQQQVSPVIIAAQMQYRIAERVTELYKAKLSLVSRKVKKAEDNAALILEIDSAIADLQSTSSKIVSGAIDPITLKSSEYFDKSRMALLHVRDLKGKSWYREFRKTHKTAVDWFKNKK